MLLTRASAVADFPGVWQLPGGGLRHGEHPVTAVAREFAEETGLTVEVTGIHQVLADVIRLPDLDVAVHTDRVIYAVTPIGGALRDESDGTTDLVDWLSPTEFTGLRMMPFTAELLGQPVFPLPEETPHPLGRQPLEPVPLDRGQRFAAYALVTDPAGRVLLSMIAPNFPGAGRWHLPGGGTDHGEQPVTGLLREMMEETGQLGRVTGLLDVSHRHNPAEFGPEGRPMDWHAVRAVYRVEVDLPTGARVIEAAGGSTASAGWFAPQEAASLPLTGVAELALTHLNC